MVVASEDFDDKLFKNAAFSRFFLISYWYVSLPPAI